MEKKKKHNKFSYKHPLLKNFYSITEDAHGFPPPSYTPSHPTDPRKVSSKVVKITNAFPSPSETFSLIVHPLHPGGNLHEVKGKTIERCQKCGGCLNPYTQLPSLLEYKCTFCSQINSLKSQQSSNFLLYEGIKTNLGERKKRMVLVIEASEYNYKSQVHLSIIDCLYALKQNLSDNDKFNIPSTKQTEIDWTENGENQIQYEVGFIFFDQEFVSVVDLNEFKIIRFKPSEFMEDDLPFEGFLKNITEINLQWLETLLKEILYESFLISQTCLLDVIPFVNKYYSLHQIQTKWFIQTLPLLLKEEDKKSQKVFESQLYQSMDFFFIIPLHKSYQVMKMFKDNVYRIYSARMLMETDIYYDLYHNMTQETFYDVAVKIRTTKNIKTLTKVKYFKKINSNKILLFDFEVNCKLKNSEDLEMIQIQLSFSDSIISINFPIMHISQKKTIKGLNGEALFYSLAHKALEKDENLRKSALISFLKQVFKVDEFDSTVLPMNLVDLFMYGFMAKDQDYFNPLFFHSHYKKYRFMNEGLETIVKQLYPKVYEICWNINSKKFEHRTLKFQSNKFETTNLWFIDNGRRITIVIGEDCPRSFLSSVFGNLELEEILDLHEIPVVYERKNKQKEENKVAHRIIENMRSINELYHLSLVIMMYDSSEFQLDFGRYFYVEENHKKFLRNLLK